MIKRIVVAILAALTVLVGQQVVSPTFASAEVTSLVKHRDISQIPTLRIWNEARTVYYDLTRGETAGAFNIPFPVAYFYVPTGWCAETNIYYNGTFNNQNRTGPGPRWVHTDGTGGYHYTYSVMIHDPGADGICN